MRLELDEAAKTVDGLQRAMQQANFELGIRDRQIAELKNALAAAGKWDLPKTVLAAKHIAEARYSQQLIFHPRVEQTIDEFRLNENINAAFAAAEIFKVMAEVLQPMVFDGTGFSEEKFKDETGIILSMTEGKASKRDPITEASRTCAFEGQEITFFPHIKDRIQGIEFRVHFSFLESGKILICHVGEHLPNAKTKFLR